MSSHQSWMDVLNEAAILGQDFKFWAAVAVGSAVKYFFSPRPATRKEAVGGVIAGAVAAYYGTDMIIRNFSTLSVEDRDLVVIGLVLTGEHLVRGIVSVAPGIVEAAFGKKRRVEEDL